MPTRIRRRRRRRRRCLKRRRRKFGRRLFLANDCNTHKERQIFCLSFSVTQARPACSDRVSADKQIRKCAQSERTPAQPTSHGRLIPSLIRTYRNAFLRRGSAHLLIRSRPSGVGSVATGPVGQIYLRHRTAQTSGCSRPSVRSAHKSRGEQQKQQQEENDDGHRDD